MRRTWGILVADWRKVGDEKRFKKEAGSCWGENEAPVKGLSSDKEIFYEQKAERVTGPYLRPP